MATRSTISLLKKNGQVISIYCHWDGYLKGIGQTLIDHYNDYKKIEELINLGSISSLNKNVSPECNKLHSFGKPLKDTVVAYHRDRGEELVIDKFKSLGKYINNKHFEEYDYIFKNKEWFIFNDVGFCSVKKLIEEIN